MDRSRPTQPLAHPITVIAKIATRLGRAVVAISVVDDWIWGPGQWLAPQMRRRYVDSLAAGVVGALLLPPFFFWYSVNLEVIDAINPGLRWSMPLAASWLVLGPILLVYQESAQRDLSDFLVRQRPDAARRIQTAARTTATLGTRAFFVLTFSTVSILAYAVYVRQGGSLVGDSISTTVFGGLMILLLGWIDGLGLWSGWRAVSIVRALTGFRATAEGSSFDLPSAAWNPFTRVQDPTVEVTSRFTLATALRFSIGTVFTPALIHISSELDAVGSLLVGVAVVAFSVSGLALFLYPMWMLHQMSVRWKDASIASVLRELNVSAEATHNLTLKELESLAPHSELFAWLMETRAEPLVLSSTRALTVYGLSTIVFPIAMLLIA